MNCVTPLAERGNGEEGEKLSLEVLVLYDGLETGLRARQILDQTLQQLEPTADMQVNFWRVDLFGEPAFLEQVARQRPDMVLFSLHARARVPASVAPWFREWFRRQGDEPRALALLLDGQAKDTPGVDELSAAARLAGVDVFLHAEEPETEWESAIEEIHRRAETKTLLLDEVLHQGGLLFREGGINE